MKIKTLTLLSSAAIALAGCKISLTEEQDPNTETQHKAISLQVLHTNDHHSHFESQQFTLALDYDTNQAGAESVQVQLGGFSKISSAIKEYRTDNTLVLNNGELNGTLYFSLFKGEVDFKVFNLLEIDAYQLGNHEFDEGDARLAELIDMANFPLLTANINATQASPLYGKDIHPYIIKKIDGEKIAIIGVLKVEKTKESSLVSDDVEFFDEIETVKQYVKEVTDKGINKIIVLSHLGYDFDQILAAQTKDIDLIIGGDTHNLLDSTGEIASMGLPVDGEFPTLAQNADGKNTYIVQAWEYAKALGRLNIDFDKNGEITQIHGVTELLVENNFKVKDSQGAWVEADSTSEQMILSRLNALKSIRTIEDDQEVETLLTEYKNKLEEYSNQVIGSIEQTMPFTRIPAAFEPGQTPTGSYSAYVVADAFMKYLPKADVAIQNAGGVRGPLNQGEFTVADAYTILPFSNTVVTIDMTGAEILKVLNQGAAYSQSISGSTGAMPYASHLRYDLILDGENTRIENLEVKSKTSGEWSAIDMNATYSVATNSFTALGKDGYLTFADVRAENPDAFEESDVAYAVPLIEYFTETLPNGQLGDINLADYCFKSVTVAAE
ncbi:bifunctional metallophosphatase/5'-nucleotidase [Gayadomonas joobiniege]|uniref:bifunctional metallophosphatase/5'-nucleotidase n=1 Tax=Gayadomonas joobiniege TaxID=1234606 RepID=UPI00035DAC69|nr:5'-nucleotidase C-terminal domain-containing protein [Gayadomonas joobiniege]